MTQLATLETLITANNTDFKTKMSESEASVGSFSAKSIASMAGIAVSFAAVGEAALKFGEALLESANKVDELSKSAEKIGLTEQSLKNLGVAANLAGSGADSLNMLFGKMNQALGGLQLGTDKYVKVFAALGLSYQNFLGLDTESKFRVIAGSLKGLNDIELETNLGMGLLGKSFKDNIGFINSDIDGVIDRFKAFGVQLDDNQKEALVSFSETRKIFDAVWEGFTEQVMASLAPALNSMLDNIEQQVTAWGGLQGVVLNLTAAVGALGTTLSFAARTAVLPFTALFEVLKEVSTQLDKVTASAAAYFGLSKSDYLKSLAVPGEGSSSVQQIPQMSGSSKVTGAQAIGQSQSAALARYEALMEATALKAQQTQDKTTLAALSAKEHMERLAIAAGDAAIKLIKLTTIADDLASRQKAAVNTVLKDALDHPDTTNPKYKAPAPVTDRFKTLLSELITNIRFPNTTTQSGTINGQRFSQIIKNTGDTNREISELNRIIKDLGEDSAGTYVGRRGYDTSVLQKALDEALSFQKNQNSAEQQKINVQVSVRTSQDLVASVTSSVAFRDKIVQQIKSTMSEAAR